MLLQRWRSVFLGKAVQEITSVGLQAVRLLASIICYFRSVDTPHLRKPYALLLGLLGLGVCYACLLSCYAWGQSYGAVHFASRVASW